MCGFEQDSHSDLCCTPRSRDFHCRGAARRYYQATTSEDPAKRHVYRIAVPGEDTNRVAASPECLTCNIKTPEGNTCSYGGATFSKAFKYAILSCLGPDPAFYALYQLQVGYRHTSTHMYTATDQNQLLLGFSTVMNN